MSISFEWNPDELYAHRGETLLQHSLAVARRTRELVRRATSAQLQEELAYVAGFCHDLAKATKDFQEYLWCQSSGQKWHGDALLKSHSKLGTQLCLVIGEHWLALKGCEELEAKLQLWLAALAIRSHHGELKDFGAEAFQINDIERGEDFQLLNKQLQRLRRPQFDALLKQFELEIELQPQIIIDHLLDKTNWEQWRGFLMQLQRVLRKDTQYDSWTFLKLIFGSLLQADKEQNLRHHFQRREFPYEMPAVHIQALKPRREIDHLRQRLFSQCTAYAEEVDLRLTKVHQLTLPTGSGKTFCGLQVASLLRRRLEAEGKQPRIIYALPFISIIEQNYEVFAGVFNERSGDLLLAHHHLAALDFKAEGEELDGVEAAFKIEGWESELIVTTFYQLFEALFSTANASNRKLAALQNAIVILDEPQALPIRFFPLLRGGLQAMIRSLGWHVVLMTATPPLLFEPDGPSCRQVVEEFKSCFAQFNRYSVVDRRQDLTSPTELLKALQQEWYAGTRRILIVANTVQSSRQVFASVEGFCREKGVRSLYLSTELLPLHRQAKIDAISKAEPIVVVSTQLIEAGVDISLDVVFRDFAPLPSLIQSAGRCRRHDWQECVGRVIVMQLHDERGDPFANKIYDTMMLDRTDSLLQDMEECGLWPMIQSYYEEIQSAISQDAGAKLLGQLVELQLSVVNRDFALIDPQGKRRDMLILFDENAHSLYQEWQELGSTMRQASTTYEERFALKAERQKVWRKLAAYLISPYGYRISKELSHLHPEGLIVIDGEIEKYYSEDIGLIPLQKGQEYVAGTNFD